MCERMVVSRVDASSIFEAGEQVLDSVARAVEHAIVGVLDAVLDVGRNAWRDAPIGQWLAQSNGAVGSIGEQETSGRKLVEHGGGSLVIVCLPFLQVQKQGPPLAIAHDLQLGSQTAPAASDTSG